MAYEVTMPRLGWTMEEGVFGEWLKQDGEEVKAGDLLFTVEGDKATQEVEVFESGILRLPQGAPASWRCHTCRCTAGVYLAGRGIDACGG